METNTILTHIGCKFLTIKLIHITNRGWKVEQTETYNWDGSKKYRTPKTKIAFFTDAQIKDLFI